MAGYSEEYKRHMNSAAWNKIRNSVFEKNALRHRGTSRCDDCNTKRGPFQVHHTGRSGEAYKDLGHENINDLRLLCHDCHVAADARRHSGYDDRPPAIEWDDLVNW